MSHIAAFEALDKTVQDIRGNKCLMGGVTFTMAGDFRQTLPDVSRGTRADEMQGSVKSSYLWRHFTKLSLNTNMRVHLHGDRRAEIFSERLLPLGNGKMVPDSDGQITMKDIGTVVDTEEELINKVFPNLQQHFRDHKWLCKRAILAPKNDAVGQINSTLLHQIPGPVQVYKSIDTVFDTSEAVQYPVEFLNSLELPGVPQHRLELKVGAPIILLRNLDPPTLCNGTRLVVRQLLPHVIEATITTGNSTGHNVFLPKIPIRPSDLPYQFKRLQFSVRLSFSMTINKAQEQSLTIAGLSLTTPCFSHGQLYVGRSRVGSSSNLFVLAPEGKTHNIVYPEALTSCK